MGKKRDVSKLPPLFPANPARRVSVSGKGKRKESNGNQVRAANESDVSGRDLGVEVGLGD